ncbi:MAG: UDP-3-O-(3-hydroxymyristoyl)glucosamine N-acyltransferase [Gammaproteobacteria bacterium]|nr:UDP-3-O-(3-hydroxymyristoyl)glucosamine N-acyltransferase [Gammaproteobacteria bacterium]MDH5225803.1 UDP-3-O-(3-hydroxymyristoyl)glucosamine N-acyltransferase [Gammaproteobacteria bacterium]
MPVRLGELAARFGCELRGDPDALIERVAPLQDAGAGSVSFLANPRYRRHLASTGATAVVLDASNADGCLTNALVATNPYATYARIAQVLYPECPPLAGRHPTAVIDPSASVDPTSAIGPHVYVGPGARIGAHVQLGPGCVVFDGVEIGAATRLVANVTVAAEVRLGERCLLHPGVVIGADGFGHAPDTSGFVKIPQVGTVVIGDDVEIGANTTVDRGAIGDTVIENGVKIDNQVQVGHNCRIGEHTVISGCVGISGSVTIGRRCMLGGMVGVVGHLQIADDVYLTGKTMVTHSITKPGLYSGQLPFDEARRFRRNSARFQQLDALARRVRKLERGGADVPQDEQEDNDND